MADTPRVTVPVEPTEAMMRAWHRSAWPQGPEVSPMSQAGLAFNRHYAAMLSAAPAPEGGAVHYSVRTEGAPGITETDPDLAPREDAPAFDLIEATVSKADGSNPRRVFVDRVEGRIYEIAPAEAVTADRLRSVPDEEMRALLSCKDVGSGRAHLASIINALRAQPQAREDAQPVAWDCEELAKTLCEMDAAHGGAEWSRRTAQQKEHYRTAAEAIIKRHAHPAPDALRVAVEALEPFAAFGRFEAAVAAQAPDIIPAPDDSVFKHWADAFDMKGPKLVYGDLRRAASVLAALQAEQKGGA